MARRAWLSLLSILLVASARGPCAAQGSKIEIASDPRVELLSAALTQSAWSPALRSFFSPYAQDVQKSAFPFRTHAAVKALDRLHAQGVELRDLFAWIEDRGPLPDLASSGSPDPELAARPGGAAVFDTLASSLADFARETRFDALYARNAEFYGNLVSAVRSQLRLPVADVEQMEVYTGIRHDGYHLLIAPLLGMTSYSWTNGDRKQAYVLISPAAFREGRLIFDPSTVSHSLWLGFGRSAAEEVIQSQPERRDAHSAWFVYVADRLRKSGISNWSDALAELVASTIAIRLTEQQGRAAAADQMKRAALARGLAWLPFTLSRMAEYEKDRSRYRSIKDFAPRLYDGLDELEPVFGGGEPGDLGLADVWLTDEGVPVKSVSPGSLAAKAGIRKGDTIQAIGGIRVNGSESYLKAWDRWEKSTNDEEVPFRVKRGKSVLLIKVTMKRAGTFQGFRKKAGKG